jgi:hypothetical protein
VSYENELSRLRWQAPRPPARLAGTSVGPMRFILIYQGSYGDDQILIVLVLSLSAGFYLNSFFS